MQELVYDHSCGVSEMYEPLSESLLCNHLSPEVILEINPEVRILSLLSAQSPHILALQQFTKSEWALLMILMQNYPHYAPYEMLLAGVTTQSSASCSQRLQEVRLKGAAAVKRELKPIYRALCGVRSKLSKLSPRLKVSLVREAGYALVVSR